MAELINPTIGPDSIIEVRADSGDEWTPIDETVGREQATLRMLRTKRQRPEANASFGTTILGWTAGVLAFVCDDDHSTRAVFWTRHMRRMQIRVRPEGEGGLAVTGTALLVLASSVTARGRVFSVRLLQHGPWAVA